MSVISIKFENCNINPFRLKNLGSGCATKIEDFDRKLAEADSYLLLLINQVAAFIIFCANPIIL